MVQVGMRSMYVSTASSIAHPKARREGGMEGGRGGGE